MLSMCARIAAASAGRAAAGVCAAEGVAQEGRKQDNGILRAGGVAWAHHTLPLTIGLSENLVQAVEHPYGNLWHYLGDVIPGLWVRAIGLTGPAGFGLQLSAETLPKDNCAALKRK